MRVILDRTKCSRQPDACPRCFAEHLTTGHFGAAECILQEIEDDRPEISLKVYDRDGSIKSFVINADNIAQAFDSWLLAWEAQAGPII
jgi:hypothetical protein